MAELKTVPTEAEVAGFIAQVEPPARREDALVLEALFHKVTGETARMWGPTIIGYGEYPYRYDSGHEGRMCRVGFSPRKAKHSLYLLDCDASAEQAFAPLLARLGRHSRGKACLYVNQLADVDLSVLEEMIALSWERSFAFHPE